MKANELMIGDWVSLDGNPQKVNYINPELGEGIGTNIHYLPFPAESYEPIPLTEEILKANGFTHEDGIFGWEYYCGEKDYFILHSDPHGKPPYSIEIARRRYTPNIKYVHELQHALRICGLNELADNFKIE